MNGISRRRLLTSAGGATALLLGSPLSIGSRDLAAAEVKSDSLPMQLYKSLSDEQKSKICLAADHKSRQFVSNWWYVHREHRINNTFKDDQKELVQSIFDSLHSDKHRADVNDQVKFDQYGKATNAPSVGFFGTPDDSDFEFIYTGHHVTRRCNAHSDQGHGFGGAPIFYGHFREKFNETSEHTGNPYWYQGKIFNDFVQSLDGDQQQRGLVGNEPRSEKSTVVIRKNLDQWPGLACADLSEDQKTLFMETMGKMLAMFRKSDVDATLGSIEKHGLLDELFVSWYSGKYDIGSDKVWDTWQIEGRNMVWYFRGQPHIHSYFHLKV